MSLRNRENKKRISEKNYDFACIITVYENMPISLPLVKSVLNQRYLHFHIYLVADKVADYEYYIEDKRLTFIKPQLALNSKVLSIDTALRAAVRCHDFVLILDADNLLHPQFLSEVNVFHQRGYQAVQGKRTAKNLETDYAALDAMGEYYYDYLVRRGPFRAGSSSTIAGSGMSVERRLYGEIIQLGLEELRKKGVVVSEDKSLQLEIVERGERIGYAEKAIIFDEKVSGKKQIQRQRTRWLNSYFRHLHEGLRLMLKGIENLSFNQFLFSMIIIMPPILILVVITGVVFLITLFVNVWISMMLFFAVFVFLISFLLTLRLNNAPEEIWKALTKIPYFMWEQIKGILHIREANRDFMTTSHQYFATFEEVWEKRGKDF